MSPASPTSFTQRWTPLGVALGAVSALLVWAPAQWLASAVSALSGERVQLRAPQGTVWQGSAQWVLTSGPGGQDALALPQRLQWHLSPQWNAGLTLSLHMPCCTPEPLVLQWQPRWGDWQISLHSPHTQWPAQWLSGLGAPWNTMALDGQLVLRSQGLVWRHEKRVLTVVETPAVYGYLGGEAELSLNQLSSGLSTLKPLGSYQLKLQGGDTPHLSLRTSQGQLLLQGEGSWRQQGFVFEGEARAQPGHEAALSNLLGVLGQRFGNRTVLRWG